MERRRFLKLTGIGVAGACAAPVASAVASGGSPESPASGVKSRRLAMVVDLRKCLTKEGCTECTKACHAFHNVPNIADKRHEVKWIWKEAHGRVFPQLVTPYMPAAVREKPTLVTCNHCENPPCVRVCPTQATFQRPDGIVGMDPHRCIGCRYCITACPYGARSFNWQDPRKNLATENASYPARTKGVVEKCTFCQERLIKGQRPLCVEACEKIGCGALTFGDLSDPASPVSKVVQANQLMRRKPELGTSPHVFYIL